MTRNSNGVVVSLVLCLLPVLAFGADAPAKPLPATEKYEATVATAEQAFEKSLLASIRAAQLSYDRAMLAAKQAYSRDLQQPLTAATKAGKLDDANAINEIKKTVDAEIKALQEKLAETQSRDVSLPPTAGEQAFVEVLMAAIKDARQAGDNARSDAPGVAAAALNDKQKDKLAKTLADTVWQQQAKGRITVTLHADFTVESSHIGGRGKWETTDGKTLRMAPFSDRKSYEFKLKDEKTMTNGSDEPEYEFDFVRRLAPPSPGANHAK
jgi:hypothetical protein